MRSPDRAGALPRLLASIALLAAAFPVLPQPARIASDFEIARMEKELASSRGFEALLGARLNLGDARKARNEQSLAREQYEAALELAETERRTSREQGALARYAIATSWAAMSEAKLGRPAAALALLDEAERYAADDAELWNLRASAMRVLGAPRKSVAAARIAVALAAAGSERALDVAVYRYALATALTEAGETGEARQILEQLTEALASGEFASLRGRAERAESFEVYSSARGDVAAFVSLWNRANLHLAAIHEREGDIVRARSRYEQVLAWRSDDATALGALARLAENAPARERWFARAFDANPFSPVLVREYRRWLSPSTSLPDGTGPGTAMRHILVRLARGERTAAHREIEALLARHPASETLRALSAEAESGGRVSLPGGESPARDELLALLNGFDALTPEQRIALDQATFRSDAAFASASEAEGATVFASGAIAGVPFRFSLPTAFSGAFAADDRLVLSYRILGVTQEGDRHVLLLEPLKLERAP